MYLFNAHVHFLCYVFRVPAIFVTKVTEWKESACNAGDWGLIPGSGRSSGEGNGYPIQYSCLGNPMERRVWGATVHGGRKESDITE